MDSFKLSMYIGANYVFRNFSETFMQIMSSERSFFVPRVHVFIVLVYNRLQKQPQEVFLLVLENTSVGVSFK